MLLLAVLSQSPSTSAEEWTAPPLVASTPPPPAPAATVSEAPKSGMKDGPLWQVGAWGTATIPTSLDGAAFMFGLRGELDVWRLGVLFSFDRSGITPLTMNDLRAWTGLVGYSVLSLDWLRVRAQAGVTALSSDTAAARVSPALGTTARVTWRFLGAEAGATFSPFDFRQLDLRAAAILHGGIFELQVGYRARFLDATTGGTLDTMFATTPSAGPHVALGINL